MPLDLELVTDGTVGQQVDRRDVRSAEKPDDTPAGPGLIIFAIVIATGAAGLLLVLVLTR